MNRAASCQISLWLALLFVGPVFTVKSVPAQETASPGEVAKNRSENGSSQIPRVASGTNGAGSPVDSKFQAAVPLSVHLIPTPSPRFVLAGATPIALEDAKHSFFVTVATDDAQPGETTHLLGSYEREGQNLVFIPRFPLSSSVHYRVHLSEELKEQLPESQSLNFAIPRQQTVASAKVAHVYPSATSLPENLLKFYIHFSEPMNRGEAYQCIELYQGGELVDHPFLELGEELWDGRQIRFTLFIHPGRIKRGLKPREDEGPAMAAGGMYTLKIKSSWKAASGLPMVEDFEKRFQVTPADHEQPRLEMWKIETPGKNTRQPVSLIFNEPLDHGMLGRVLVVKHQSGKIIPGAIEIAQEEMQWHFVPEEPWPVGAYNIEVAANLEDLCGNSIARPFEVKMQERAAAPPTTKVAIEFIVK